MHNSKFGEKLSIFWSVICKTWIGHCFRGKNNNIRVCLFWVKITSENAFPEMGLFGWFGKFYFSEIEIRWPKKNGFDHGNHFTLPFSLQSISGKREREREGERARARGEDRAPVSPTIAGEIRAPVRADLARLRSTLREIAISDCDRRRGRRTGAREALRRQTQLSVNCWWFFSWVCLFLLLFQTPENIFRKIF